MGFIHYVEHSSLCENKKKVSGLVISVLLLDIYYVFEFPVIKITKASKFLILGFEKLFLKLCGVSCKMVELSDLL